MMESEGRSGGFREGDGEGEVWSRGGEEGVHILDIDQRSVAQVRKYNFPSKHEIINLVKIAEVCMS